MTDAPLDLSLAYARVRDELRGQATSGRTFVANACELDLAETDTQTWLEQLERRVFGGTWRPGPIDICDAPKGASLVRPAARLSLEDRVVYTAAVGACLEQVYSAIQWAQGGTDFAPRIDPAQVHGRDWLRNHYKGWREWHDRSLQRLDSPSFEVVLTADIAGFFENISIPLLISDLRRVEAPSVAIETVSTSLNTWSVASDRGLPQGIFASDILAKLYLEPFDRRVRHAGYTHLRYVDDIRLFARTETEAKTALVLITRTLRERGLTLQSAKTQIRRKSEVRPEIDGVVPVIEQLRRDYLDEIRAVGLMAADESLPMSELDDRAAGADGIEPEVLRRAFDAAVEGASTPNRSLFNFLLNRLGPIGDQHAVWYCAGALRDQPELTSSILKYFAALNAPADLEKPVVDALVDQTSATYPYQRYQLLQWLDNHATELEQRTVVVLRHLAFRPESTGYVQAQARRLLGRFGDSSDLDQIEVLFRSTADPLVRAQLLACLSRLERGRRNSLAGRVQDAPGLLGLAAGFVRAE